MIDNIHVATPLERTYAATGGFEWDKTKVQADNTAMHVFGR